MSICRFLAQQGEMKQIGKISLCRRTSPTTNMEIMPPGERSIRCCCYIKKISASTTTSREEEALKMPVLLLSEKKKKNRLFPRNRCFFFFQNLSFKSNILNNSVMRLNHYFVGRINRIASANSSRSWRSS